MLEIHEVYFPGGGKLYKWLSITSPIQSAVALKTEVDSSPTCLVILTCYHLSLTYNFFFVFLVDQFAIFLFWAGDVARVNGQLAVSRAFGDKNLKTHLRSDPDITPAEINADTDLLILASDGLWKVSFLPLCIEFLCKYLPLWKKQVRKMISL